MSELALIGRQSEITVKGHTLVFLPGRQWIQLQTGGLEHRYECIPRFTY